MNPYAISTRPSNVPVCQFQHTRIKTILRRFFRSASRIIASPLSSVNRFYGIFGRFFTQFPCFSFPFYRTASVLSAGPTAAHRCCSQPTSVLLTAMYIPLYAAAARSDTPFDASRAFCKKCESVNRSRLPKRPTAALLCALFSYKARTRKSIRMQRLFVTALTASPSHRNGFGVRALG